MPDLNSPKLTMGEDDFPAMRSESSENPPTRGWTCPDDLTIAAYVDNALSQTRKARVELHLSKCERCRVIVTDVVKLQREIELPLPPSEFARIPVQLAPPVSAGFRWIWAPAAATALAFIVLVTVVIGLLREPQKLLVSLPPPSAPMVASIRVALSATAANASLISTRSRSGASSPAFLSALLSASAGTVWSQE